MHLKHVSAFACNLTCVHACVHACVHRVRVRVRVRAGVDPWRQGASATRLKLAARLVTSRNSQRAAEVVAFLKSAGRAITPKCECQLRGAHSTLEMMSIVWRHLDLLPNTLEGSPVRRKSRASRRAGTGSRRLFRAKTRAAMVCSARFSRSSTFTFRATPSVGSASSVWQT